MRGAVDQGRGQPPGEAPSLVAGGDGAAEARLDAATRDRAAQRNITGDLPGDAPAVLRRRTNQKLSGVPARRLPGRFRSFELARGLRTAAVAVARDRRARAADRVRELGEPDAGSR